MALRPLGSCISVNTERRTSAVVTVREATRLSWAGALVPQTGIDPVLRKDCKRTITISFTYCSSFMCLAFQHTLSSNVLQCLAKIIMGLFANVSILSSHICLTFLLQRKKLVNLCQKKLSFMYGMSLYL